MPSIGLGKMSPQEEKSMAKWKAWGDHPVYVTLSAIGTIVAIIVSVPALCQSPETRGVVRDSKTRRPIAMAKVTFQFRDFSRLVYTDDEGVYHLPLRPEAYGKEGSIVVEKDGDDVYKRHVAIDQILEEIFLTPVSKFSPADERRSLPEVPLRLLDQQEKDRKQVDFYGCDRTARDTVQCEFEVTNQSNKRFTTRVMNAELNERRRGSYPGRTIRRSNKSTNPVNPGESVKFTISFTINPHYEDFDKLLLQISPNYGDSYSTFRLPQSREDGNSLRYRDEPSQFR